MKKNQVEVHVKNGQEKFDWQWVNLMLEAREIGLSPDEVREFLKTTVEINTRQ